jgi:hypothetical protein
MPDHAEAIVEEAPSGAVKTNDVYDIYKQDAPKEQKRHTKL